MLIDRAKQLRNGERRGGTGGKGLCFLNGDIQQIIEFFWPVLRPPPLPGLCMLTCWVVAAAMTAGLLHTLPLKLSISGRECHDDGCCCGPRGPCWPQGTVPMLMVSGPPLGNNATCCCGPRGEIPSFPSMEVDDRSADGAHAPVHPDRQGCTPDGGCDEAVPDDALHGDDGSLTQVDSPAHLSGDIVQKSGRNKMHRRRRSRTHAKWKRDMQKCYSSDESSFSERKKKRRRQYKKKDKNRKKRKKEESDPNGVINMELAYLELTYNMELTHMMVIVMFKAHASYYLSCALMRYLHKSWL